MIMRNDDDAFPDWPPQTSASTRAEGERAYGSTGQLFIVQNRQWVRVRKPRLVSAPPSAGNAS